MANEKRLIDANILESWIDGGIQGAEEGNGNAPIVSLHDVLRELDSIPTVDAAEVVRCKDCKHWQDSWVAPDGKHEHGYCHMEESDDVVVGRWDDDFCSYGERKDIVWKNADPNWERITNFNGIPIDGEERKENG